MKPLLSDHQIEQVLATPMGRRSVLALGARAAYSLCVTLGVGAMLGLVQSLAGCQRAPGTAREQFIYISEEKEMSMGLTAFREVLRQAPLNENPEINEMVHRVGNRIAKAANKPEYQWEFAVIQDDRTINAFALPGGKVAVFTGILKVTKNEDGLATVMGHEVAHALQRHGAERMSRGLLEQIGQLAALGAGAAAGRPDAAMAAMTVYGLRLMAQAGYDPREAVSFWERMSGCPRAMINKLCFRSQQAIPEFLSTHPSDVTRINQIEAWIPDALKYYHPAQSPAHPLAPVQPYRPPVGPMPEAPLPTG